MRSCSYKGEYLILWYRLITFLGDLFVHSWEWSVQCNRCKCINGSVECTQMNCGRRECNRYNQDCSADEECVSLDTPSRPNCVSATCQQRFFCVKRHFKPANIEQCSTEITQATISKINLQFRLGNHSAISQLVEGVHSSDVCSAIRYLREIKKFAEGQTVTIDCCSNSIGNVLVTIVSTAFSWFDFKLIFPATRECERSSSSNSNGNDKCNQW